MGDNPSSLHQSFSMSSQNQGSDRWIDKIKGKVKLDSDDLGCGCVVLSLSVFFIFILVLIIPPFLENWERPIKVGDFGRLLTLLGICSAFYFPFKFIIWDSKDPLWEKVKALALYALWLVILIYILEYCLNSRNVSLSELFRDGSFRYLR